MLEQPKTDGDYLGKTATDGTMADQQVTAAEIGWLAGIVDGEGCVGVQHVTTSKKTARGYCLSARLSVTNTDPAIIAKTAEILQGLGVGYYIMSRKQDASRREVFILRVDKFVNLAKLLPPLIPVLVGEKQAKSKLVLEFVQTRLSKMCKGGRVSNQPYSERELAIHTILRSWNPNDYTLPADSLAADLRRYSLDSVRKPESAAEMTAPSRDHWTQHAILRG